MAMNIFSKISKINKKYLYGLSLLLAVLVSSSAGYFFGMYTQRNNYAEFMKSFKNIRENTNKYSFINPLVGGSSAPATDVGIFSDVKGDIVSYLGGEEKEGNLYNYSLYFRDLGTGFWFGVNESADFSPASLLKLPIAIAAYKEGENEPYFLNKTAVYTEEISKINSSVTSNSDSVLVVGQSYSVEDLVKIMLVQSDNGAKNLLLTIINKAYLNQLFSVVALDDPQSSGVYQISSIKYALFLRVLYGASYLNDDNSEKILGYLSKSTFNDGLVAGLPKSVPVAHKYGVYEFDDTLQGKAVSVQQLHDCGVIYHATKPYVVCIMTKGKDLPNLYRIIAHVSKIIYDNQEADK